MISSRRFILFYHYYFLLSFSFVFVRRCRFCIFSIAEFSEYIHYSACVDDTNLISFFFASFSILLQNAILATAIINHWHYFILSLWNMIHFLPYFTSTVDFSCLCPVYVHFSIRYSLSWMRLAGNC